MSEQTDNQEPTYSYTFQEEITEKRFGRFYTSLENKNVIQAFVKATMSMEAAKKDSKNPHFNSKYADLASCLDVVQPALAAQNLTLVQPADLTDDGKAVFVGSMIIHESGEYLRWDFTLPLGSKMTAHEVGSCITYARRYSLCALGIKADDDDDGNVASGSQPRQQAPAPRQQRSTPPAPAPAPQAQAKKETTASVPEPSKPEISPDLDDAIKKFCAARNTTEQVVVKFFDKIGIANESNEDKTRMLRLATDHTKMLSVVGQLWGKTGKSFRECLDEVEAAGNNWEKLPWMVAATAA